MIHPVERGSVHDDDRGRLVPVEFDGLPFRVRRAFVVMAMSGAARRGGHRADCVELMVLVSGTVTVTLTEAGGTPVDHALRRPGDRLLIEAHVMVDYVLETGGSSVLVLADRPFGVRYDPSGEGE